MSTVNLGIEALKEAYRSGKDPRELILQLRQQALAQSNYNAWITLLEVSQLDFYLAFLDGKNPDDLPLYGVPFAIKDNIDLANIPTTAACPNFSYIPKESAFVVQLLLAAGAIPLGKTNLDQFAAGLVGTRSPYGEGKNVFNSDFISGGSSAGSAIATALGQVSFALGTDTAGSGRVPAALNNLIGHKPSKGLLSTRGVVAACRTLDCVSILTLNTDDAALVFDISAQYDTQDAYSRHNTYSNRKRYYSASTANGFRFGVPQILDFQGNDETCAFYDMAKEKLIGLGGTAIEINFDPFIQAAKLLYEGPWVAERWLATQNVDHDSMLDVIRTIFSSTKDTTAADSFAAQYRLQTLKKQCDALIDGLDFVLTPTIPTLFTREQIAEKPIINNSVLGTYTNFMNLLDYCGTAVPIGFTNSGVSWGVTLFAHAFEDIKLLQFAGALQHAFKLPQGATGHALAQAIENNLSPISKTIDIAVCGAHLKGQPLNWQLTERGGSLKAETVSSAKYKLYALPDNKRPAMVRDEQGGQAIALEVWSLPSDTFGSFVSSIAAPLGIGKVELADGQWLSGFICDGYGLIKAKDISRFSGWRAWLKTRQAIT